jgi:hypothetical protein
MTRKHLALTVAHEDEARVGTVAFYDSPKARLTKNKPSPITVLDESAEDFRTVGREVSLGYVDFEDEAEYDSRAVEAMERKLREIDREWLEQAGIATEVLDE